MQDVREYLSLPMWNYNMETINIRSPVDHIPKDIDIYVVSRKWIANHLDRKPTILGQLTAVIAKRSISCLIIWICIHEQRGYTKAYTT